MTRSTRAWGGRCAAGACAAALAAAAAALLLDPPAASDARSSVEGTATAGSTTPATRVRGAPRDVEARVAASPAQAGLRVRVTDGAGDPLPGARVALRSADGAVHGQTCAADGRVRFPPRPGPVEVIAVAPGHLVPQPRHLASLPAEEVLFALDAGAALTLAVEREDGAPLGPGGAEVALEDPPAAWLAPDAPLRTDAAGRITLQGLPADLGSARIVASAPGCARASVRPGRLDEAPLRLVLPALRLSVSLDPLGLRPGADLALELRGPSALAHREPLAGARLTVDLPEEGEGWARLVQQGASTPWRRFAVSAAAPHAHLTLGLGPLAVLGGLVVDPSGDPVADVVVTAVDAGGEARSTRTGPDGRFSARVPVGEGLEVTAQRPGWSSPPVRAAAPDDLLVLVLTPTARVASRPFLGPDARPLAGRVSFTPAAGDAHDASPAAAGFDAPLDPQGHLELKELPAGRWTVSLLEPAGDELRAWVLEADVAPGACLALELNAPARHPLRGRVAGAPREGLVQVELRPADPAEGAFSFLAARAADPEGEFAFAEVPPGRYRVRAVWDGGHTEAREVELPGTQGVVLPAR